SSSTFLFTDPPTTKIYTLSLHDALPIYEKVGVRIIQKALEEPLRWISQNAGLEGSVVLDKVKNGKGAFGFNAATEEYEDLVKARSEEHTSELQSPCNLVCRLLLEKKKR